jgi:chemotaxis protein MotB
MSANKAAPVIIKRKKIVAGGGHHGGAWKVAYADFVTAMMAFFLLMWLLNATTEKQRKGIADYFNPTIPVNRISGGGEGAFGGDSVFTEDSLAENGTGGSNRNPTEENRSKGDTGVKDGAVEGDLSVDAASFSEIAKALSANSGESMASDRALRHIVTRVTDEGLIIELFDLPGEPLFEADGTTPTPLTTELAEVLARVFALVGNKVAVNGHVRSYPVMLMQDPVWPLSADRATALRKLIVASGLDDRRFERVTGFADRDPVAVNPTAVRNNRIEVILLRAGVS